MGVAVSNAIMSNPEERARWAKDECIGRLYELVSDLQPGVHFIGEHRAGVVDIGS